MSVLPRLARMTGPATRVGRGVLAALGIISAASAGHAATKLSLLYSLPQQYGPVLGGTSLYDGGLIGTVGGGCCGATFFYDFTHGQFNITHVFASADGAGPNTLMADATGTIYATAGAGGANGWGTLFSIGANGVFRKLYDFTNGADGASPNGRLAIDAHGLLYGVTGATGPGNGGTIFRFDPKTSTLTTLYHFSGGADGGGPVGSLVWDGQRDLLGVTSNGGKNSVCPQGCGVLFSYTPASSRFKVLHRFRGGRDGAVPRGGLTRGRPDTFYGTTSPYGSSDGIIFSIDARNGHFGIAFDFSAARKTGQGCTSLTLGSGDTLYGAAPWGGPHGEGEIFRFETGNHAYRTLYAFAGETDGGFPAAGLSLGTDGTVFGATSSYGANDEGTLFQLSR